MYFKNKDVMIHVRVSTSMRDDLIEITKKHGTTLSALVRYVIEYYLLSETVEGGMDMHEDK